MTSFCPICEQESAQEIVRDRVVTANGHELMIKSDRFMECAKCGEAFYTDEQANELERKVNEGRRKAEGLLTGDEIKRIRQSLMLSQDELQAALGIGRKTVVRWETGTSVQSKAIDDVLRLIALDPDNLRLLVRLRDAAMAPLMETKLLPQDEIKSGELREAIYAGLEQANVDMTYADRITASIVQAISEHRWERIKRSTERAVDEVRIAC